MDSLLVSGGRNLYSDFDFRTAQLLNRHAYTIAFLILPFAFVHFYFGYLISTAVVALICVFLCAVPILNKRNYYSLARHFFLLLCNAGALYFCLILPAETHIAWVFTPLLITPSILFFNGETRTVVNACFWSFASATCMVYILVTERTTLSLAPEMVRIIEILNVSTIICGFFSQILYWMLAQLDTIQKLNAKQGQLELAIKSSGLGIWDWHITDNILNWDDHMYKLFGVNPQSVKPTDHLLDIFSSVLLDDDRIKLDIDINKAIQNRSDLSSEFKIKRIADGEIRSIRAEAKCFYDEQYNILRMVGANWDVTNERMKELNLRQSSKLSSLGEMAAGISHEINNPLAIIKAKSQLLLLQADRNNLTLESAIQAARDIDRTTDRIVKIIQGLRTFARDPQNDPFEKFALKTIVEDTLAFCKSRFSQNGIHLKVQEIKDDIMIECRPSQISQVLLNMLNNSFDATEHLPFKWTTIECVEFYDRIQLSVTDSGEGIPLDLQQKILQPFFTTKSLGKGTGLGLSISSGIIKSHRGTLELDPNCKNTRFVITLPKVQSPAQTALPKIHKYSQVIEPSL